jgi:carbamate kinase
MSEEEAKKRRDQDGWVVVEDAGRGWRRVVASPIPVKIVEAPAIQSLVRSGYVVVGVGGGGIPVVEKENGDLIGADAVIDKDFGSSVLASLIHADLFVISTAVEKVAINFNKPDQKSIDRMTVSEAKKYMAEGQFAKGSMLPKIQAILRFLENGGKQAIVTNPENISKALRGETGTWIVKD